MLAHADARRNMRILLLVSFLVGAAAFGVSRLRDSAPQPNVEADVAGGHFSFPSAYARDAATASGGSADRLAFAVAFPDFSPLEPASALLTPRALTERDQRIVFITVSPPDEAIEPAERPSRLYARFLEGDVWSGPRGLIMRRFERGSPYELEQLYIAPPDGRTFFARCLTPHPAEKTPPEMCFSIFRIKSFDVELRFAPLLLQHWDTLNEGARDFIDRIGAGDDDKR
ncbi:MAG: hypothetical protein HYZ60_04560 [Methylocystis sp.]|nr:hypothetical protein [Methylocystis sp.]